LPSGSVRKTSRQFVETLYLRTVNIVFASMGMVALFTLTVAKAEKLALPESPDSEPPTIQLPSPETKQLG
jgi:hypothetical protein